MISGLSKQAFLENSNLSASRKWLYSGCCVHWHEFYEIEYVISGTGTYTINEQPFPIKSGMLYFMTPADFHNVDTQNADIINIMFSDSLVSSDILFTFTHQTAPKAFALTKSIQDFFMPLLDEIVHNQEDNTYSSALLNCLLLKLAKSFPSNKEDLWNKSSQKIHFFMINHFREKISLQDAAAFVGLTPSYVSAVFKKEMGKNFKQYLDDLRFAYAQKLLLYSDLSILQVCEESGFDDYPNFLRRFKNHFKITPSQMRQDSSK